MSEKARHAVGGGVSGGVERALLSARVCHQNTTKPPRRQAICLPDGRTVGEVIGDTFRKHVQGSRHMLQKPRAWAGDGAVLRQAEALGARIVEVHDLEDGTVYSAPLERFWQRGIRVNRGYGEQVALLLSDWLPAGQPAVEAVQLSLLEVAA